MPESLFAQLDGAMEITVLAVFVRLVVALIFGGLVVVIYRQTRLAEAVAPSFTTTLVMLAILIAMVTQVIGDNVARAFSLVGALAIVRFRTVVRDTQDTAYVIFAVVVGMAAGAGDPWVGGIGLVVVGFAAYLTREKSNGSSAKGQPHALKIRLGIGHDLGTSVDPVLDTYLTTRRLKSMKTASEGVAIDALYDATLDDEHAVGELVKTLNRVDGVQSVQVQRRDLDPS